MSAKVNLISKNHRVADFGGPLCYPPSFGAARSPASVQVVPDRESVTDVAKAVKPSVVMITLSLNMNEEPRFSDVVLCVMRSAEMWIESDAKSQEPVASRRNSDLETSFLIVFTGDESSIRFADTVNEPLT